MGYMSDQKIFGIRPPPITKNPPLKVVTTKNVKPTLLFLHPTLQTPKQRLQTSHIRQKR